MPDSTDGNVGGGQGYWDSNAGDKTGEPGQGVWRPYTPNMADPADRRAFDNARHADEAARYRASMAAKAKAAYEAEQARIAAEHAQYARSPIDMGNAPAWWQNAGVGQSQQTQPVQDQRPEFQGSPMFKAIQGALWDSGQFNNELMSHYKPEGFQGQYRRQPVNLGQQQRQPTGQFSWQQNTPQLPVAPQAPSSMPAQRPQRPAPQFADVSKPRYALGIPNWRNYSSALRR